MTTELIQQIFACVSAFLILAFVFVLFVFAIVFEMKAKDKRNAYLKTLTKEERAVISKLEDNKLTLKEFFNKDNFDEREDNNEDK